MGYIPLLLQGEVAGGRPPIRESILHHVKGRSLSGEFSHEPANTTAVSCVPLTNFAGREAANLGLLFAEQPLLARFGAAAAAGFGRSCPGRARLGV